MILAALRPMPGSPRTGRGGQKTKPVAPKGGQAFSPGSHFYAVTLVRPGSAETLYASGCGADPAILAEKRGGVYVVLLACPSCGAEEAWGSFRSWGDVEALLEDLAARGIPWGWKR